MQIAAFTIVRNERYFLPIWLKHYNKVLNWNDIYILDNGTTDGSADYLQCNVIKKISKTAFNAKWMLSTVTDFYSKLLDWYDYVIFSEVDELIFHRYNDLFKYIKYCDKDAVRCDGYDVKQFLGDKKKKIKSEPEIDLNKPLLYQRKQWYHNMRFCKTVIARIPLTWDQGFHVCKKHVPIDKNVIMVHLHKLDFKLAMKRNLERMNTTMDQVAKVSRKGWQNFIKTENEMLSFWEKGHSGMGEYELIPEWIKEQEICL